LNLIIINCKTIKCLRREEITVETNTTEDMLEPSFVSTVADIVQKIRLSKDSPSEILLINHPKRILKKTELSNTTLFQSCISKCNIVSVVPSTPESSKSDQSLTEESELPHKESKEMLLVKSELKPNERSDFI